MTHGYLPVTDVFVIVLRRFLSVRSADEEQELLGSILDGRITQYFILEERKSQLNVILKQVQPESAA